MATLSAEDMLKIRTAALSHFQKGHLTLFDAKTENQCHLEALRIVELYQQTALCAHNTATLSEIEQEFITNSYILSSPFCYNLTVFNELTCTNITADNLKALRQESQASINNAILEYTRTKLATLPASELKEELIAIIDDEDIKPFPKLAGVKVFLHQIGSHPLILRGKTLCKEGTHLESYVKTAQSSIFQPLNHEEISKEEPVIVIDAIATTSKEIFDTAKKSFEKCPHNLFHRVKTGKHHICHLCQSCHSENTCGYSHQQRVANIASFTANQLLNYAGADFMRFDHVQKAFPLKQYSQFSQEISVLQRDAIEAGVDAENPTLFKIDHVSAALYEHVLSSSRRYVDTIPQEIAAELEGLHV